jgi:ParB-like chromosome segregation protein Spo0J
MKRHALSKLFGDMTKDELAKLTNDIRQSGLNHPITIWQGEILDGWHRYQACKSAGVEPVFKTFDGADIAALRFVMQENALRRHLSDAARIAISKKVLGWHEARAGVGRKSNGSSEPIKSVTNAHVAEASGTSLVTVKRHNTVEQSAPRLMPLVESGDIGLKTAERLVQSVDVEVLEKATPAQVKELAQSLGERTEALIASILKGSSALRDASIKLSSRSLTQVQCDEIQSSVFEVRLAVADFERLVTHARQAEGISDVG